MVPVSDRGVSRGGENDFGMREEDVSDLQTIHVSSVILEYHAFR